MKYNKHAMNCHDMLKHIRLSPVVGTGLSRGLFLTLGEFQPVHKEIHGSIVSRHMHFHANLILIISSRLIRHFYAFLGLCVLVRCQ